MENSVLQEKLTKVLDEEKVATDLPTRQRLSEDYYWYSPILKEMLDDKVADYVVFPENEEDIIAILRFAVTNHIPVTVRGSGTGNYGQSVPLQGGILLDTTKMNHILEISKGQIRVETGVILGDIEKKLRAEDQELCIYSSTFLEATAGGFFCGGSGGIGSIKWGNLWSGNVKEVKVVTMEESPRVLTITGDDLMDYLHGYGTTGIVTEVVYRTTERVNWMECLVSFEHLNDSIKFAKELAEDENVDKRSISTAEWPIPSYFRPLKRKIKDGEHVVILEINEASFEYLKSQASKSGGEITYINPSSKYHVKISLSNFTFNHTTLWALKADEQTTYIQVQFDVDNYLEQVTKMKEEFGDELLNAFDILKENGNLILSAIPLIQYTTKERLDEIIAFCKSIGVNVLDPHTVLLEEGGWDKHIHGVVKAKAANDPYGLLNPGKIGIKNTSN